MKKILFVFLLGIVLMNSINALTITSVLTNPKEVSPGEEFLVLINLKNNFDSNIEDVYIKAELSNLPISPVNSIEDYINEIEDGKSETGSIKLIAESDASAGIYKIPITIKYTEEGEEYTRNSVFSVIINSKPSLILNIEENLLKNQQNELGIKLTNNGLTKIKFLEVELKDSSFYEIISPSKVYIGDLDSGDFDNAEFKIYLKDNSYFSFPIFISYRDSTNKIYTETKYLSTKVYSIKEAQELGILKKSSNTFLILIVLGVVIFLYYRFRKKRKLKK
jgi:hypothetical protein